MKHTKRPLKTLLSLLLAAAMLIPTTVFASYAEDGDLSDHLLIHYDFEGASSAEALKDKASGGTVSDDLMLGKPASYTADFTVDSGFVFENGTAKLRVSGYKINLQTGSALNSADIKAVQEGNATWFLRFSVADGKGAQVLDLRDFTNTRSFYMHYTNGAFTGGTATAAAPATNVSLFDNNYPGTRGEARFNSADGWINLAIIREQAANGTYNITVYYSFGTPNSATSWFSYSAAKNIASLAPMTNGSTWGSKINLFQDGNYGSVMNTADGLTYDDVRFYDTAMTLDQINGMMKEANLAPDSAAAKTAFYGYQLKAPYTNEEGVKVFDVRLLATIDSKDYSKAGINFSTFGRNIHWSDNPMGYKKEVTHCFSSVLSNTDYTTEVTAAPDGTYFIAVTLTGIPTTALTAEARSCLKIAVTSYVTDFDGLTTESVSKFFTVTRADLGL